MLLGKRIQFNSTFFFCKWIGCFNHQVRSGSDQLGPFGPAQPAFRVFRPDLWRHRRICLRFERGLQNEHRLDQVRVENSFFFQALWFVALYLQCFLNVFTDIYHTYNVYDIHMCSTCVARFPDLREFWFWTHSCLSTSRKIPAHGQVWMPKKKVPSGYP